MNKFEKLVIKAKTKKLSRITLKSKGNCQRLIRKNISSQVEKEIKKILELKMEELKQ